MSHSSFRVLAVALLFLPAVALGQSTGVTISATPSAVELGQNIQVQFSVSGTFRTSDSIVMFRGDTNQVVSSQSVGPTSSGTKTFSIKKTGSYYFQYKANLSGNPALATSGIVQVSIPDSSKYTLTLSSTSVSINQPITVSYAAPAHAHQSGDDLVLLDSQNRIISSQSLGIATSGTKSFVIKSPGTYRIEYRLSLAGSPVVKTSNPITVIPPSSSLYSLSISPSPIQSGETISVTYAGPAVSHQTSDSIVIVDAQNRTVASERLGASSTGTKSFRLRDPGSYSAQYRLSIAGTPVIKTAGPVTVQVPNSNLFTLTPNVTRAEQGQSVSVAFTAPAFAHQSGDDILVLDANTNAILTSVNVGSSLTGTKTFRFLGTGTFKFAYRMDILGLPVVKESVPITVVLVNLERITNYPLRNGPVIAFGDSITFGRDASPGNNYVSLLANRIGEPIVNVGVNGDTTADALARIETDVLSKDPRLVILFLGGNDFLQRIPKDTIFANLELVIDKILADGAAIVMVGYQDFLLFTNYDATYRDIAIRKGVAYTPDVMRGILGRYYYTTDGVHPRDNGHALIADRIEPYLRAFLGSSSRSLAPSSLVEVVAE